MTDLVVHPASAAERLAAFRNVHEFWGGDTSLEEFLERRLHSAQHNFARWFVGCQEGQVVTSLGCYPLNFGTPDRLVAGIAIGAVHTLPDFRGRGLAPQLFRGVEQYWREQGIGLSVLFSDIDPAYYARLGYRRCPAWYAWQSLEAAVGQVQVGTVGTARLDRIDAAEHKPALQKWYETSHRALPIWVARDDAYWDYALAKEPRDEFFWLRDADEEVRGYVRLGRENDRLFIRDLAIEKLDSVEDWNRLLRAVWDQARRDQRATRIGGWLPDIPAVRQAFELEQRKQEVTMLKALRNDVALDDLMLGAAQHFREIDHV